MAQSDNQNPETPVGRRVAVKAPATTANLGPGFDTLGLALKLYSTVALTETDGGLVIECAGECSESIPRDESNIVYRTAEMVFSTILTVH